MAMLSSAKIKAALKIAKIKYPEQFEFILLLIILVKLNLWLIAFIVFHSFLKPRVFFKIIFCAGRKDPKNMIIIAKMKIYATGSQLNDEIFNFDFLEPNQNYWAFSWLIFWNIKRAKDFVQNKELFIIKITIFEINQLTLLMIWNFW
ncbi:hypothetical protein BpHYR1_022371 [Brachionus plicatilis]|uniref:Uncharacterized protein n=1 Tax=Brachionus plicatilis TaxID=10195 RepID=A0A3M7PIT7_BRAPC|nr:hypothetical protein BpHYR1_022371 [Brachionus plicatilis]